RQIAIANCKINGGGMADCGPHAESLLGTNGTDSEADLNRCYNRIVKSRNGSAALLERLLEPVSRSLNAEAAKELIKLKADPKTQARVDELARKCNESDLTTSERSEYERYVTAGNLVAILQAQARLILSRKP